ncbi:MAG: hypothetical protein J0M12_15955 [Deltaproteobacteria bacterium]|nr:hypothetical protein [Deltaproteobacteria bacterium]
MRSPFSKAELLLAIPSAAILIFVQLQLLPYCADDAYIHFRIAQNLATNGAPYFNPEQAVMATSSIVWTLLLGAIFFVVGYAPALVAVVNALITVGAAIVFSRLAATLYGQSSERIATASFILTLACLLSSSIQLMETPLALLLLGLGLHAYFRGRSIAFVWLVLACFTRLEFLAFLAVVLGENFLYRRVPLKAAALSIAAAAMPLIVLDYYFFGTIVPQTVVAKSVIYNLSSSEFLTFAVAGLLGKYLFYTYPLIVLIYFALLTTITIYLSLLHLHPPEYVVRDQRALVILAGGLLVFLTYTLKQVYIFPWYVPLYSLPIFFALLFMATTKKSTPLKLLATLLIAPTLFSFCRDLAAGLGVASVANYSEYEGGVRAQAYRGLGAKLGSACPQCKLMAAEIGGLGSAFPGFILDAAGLASPEALPYQKKLMREKRNSLGGIIPPEFVRSSNPDYIVGMKSFLEEFAGSDVAKEYRAENVEISPASLAKVLGEPLQLYTKLKKNS